MNLYSKASNLLGFSKFLFTQALETAEVSLEPPEHCYKPVYFAAYVRTDYDNLVLTENDEMCLYSEHEAGNYAHIMYSSLFSDMGLLCGRKLLDKFIKTDSVDVWGKIAKQSTCYPVGAVETADSIVIVFSVVVSVELLKDPDIVIEEGFYFSPIETYSPKDALCAEIAKSLILVPSKE